MCVCKEQKVGCLCARMRQGMKRERPGEDEGRALEFHQQNQCQQKKKKKKKSIIEKALLRILHRVVLHYEFRSRHIAFTRLLILLSVEVQSERRRRRREREEG